MIKKAFKALADSRGFSIPRLVLTGLYIFMIAYCAPLFAGSVGNYPVQLLSIGGTVVGALLLWRSVKKIFDRRMRDKIVGIARKVWQKTSAVLARFGLKIVKALGLDKKRAHGKDETDFVFRDRRGKKRGAHRLKNPMRWTELEDNAQKVRYIFIEFMLRSIKNGYRLKPASTPDDIARDLASDECEDLLFSAYRLARYSGGREPIDDQTVEALADLKDKKKKKTEEQK